MERRGCILCWQSSRYTKMSCHDADFAINGWTEGCHNDKLQWRQSRRHDNSQNATDLIVRFSMTPGNLSSSPTSSSKVMAPLPSSSASSKRASVRSSRSSSDSCMALSSIQDCRTTFSSSRSIVPLPGHWGRMGWEVGRQYSIMIFSLQKHIVVHLWLS